MPREAHEKPGRARVEIAKDVLAGLALGKLEARSNYAYVDIPGGHGAKVFDELKAVLGRVEKCQVCGIGSLMVALVSRDNDYTLESCDFWTDGTINANRTKTCARLWPYFDHKELEAIEGLFERDRRFSFSAREPGDDRLCLAAIMQSIVGGRGVFDEEKTSRRLVNAGLRRRDHRT